MSVNIKHRLRTSALAFVTTVLPPLVTLVVVTLLVEGYVRLRHVPEYLVPAPSAVIKQLLQNPSRGELLASAFTTGKAALAGFAMSAVLGVTLAITLSTARWIERAFYPYAVFFQTVPIIAIAPLLTIWFGDGFRAVAISAFIVSVFPVIANTLTGILSVDPALRDMFRLYRASWWSTLIKLRVPWALPNIFTGLRIAAGLAVIGAVVGEFVAGTSSDDTSGLGILVLRSNKQGNTAQVFAAVIMASALGLLLFAAVNFVSWLLLRRWHASASSR